VHGRIELEVVPCKQGLRLTGIGRHNPDCGLRVLSASHLIKMEGKHKRQALGLASRQQVRINEVQPGLGLAAGRHGEHIRPGDAKVHYLNCGALSRGGHQLQVRTSKSAAVGTCVSALTAADNRIKETKEERRRISPFLIIPIRMKG